MDNLAVITGGAGGMGLATAKILGADHRLLLSDVTREGLDAAVSELAGLGIEADAMVCDVTDRQAVKTLFSRARETGGLRAVVHTAGVSPQMGSPETILRINALGTVHITEAALPLATEGFAVVLVASMAGHGLPRVLVPKRAFPLATTDPDTFIRKTTAAATRVPKAPKSGLAYAISKTWVIWYAEEQAPAFGAQGARILSVSPGSFDTAMGRLEISSGSAKVVELAALKRFGKPEEIAEVLAFCASEKPGYLTGTDVLCDGGNTAGMARNKTALLRRR